MKHLIIFCTILISALHACRASTIGFAYWDLDALHDTTPSLFHNDSDYTPKGRLNWSKQRYDDKIQGVASILDSLKMPIIAIAGVESEEVARDIVRTTSLGYNYIHRTLPSLGGLDVALLYFGDILFPESVRVVDGKLHITGELLNHPCEIWLIQNGDATQGVTIDPRSQKLTIVAGNISHFKGQSLKLRDPLHDQERRGYGNAYSQMGWYLRHRILTSPNIDYHNHGIYINRRLLDTNYQPLPTYDNKNYRGGISRYLPVYIYFDIDN
ncbi:MAG: hypothetical protein SNH13_06845 [Rikenellaceae bacterium]